MALYFWIHIFVLVYRFLNKHKFIWILDIKDFSFRLNYVTFNFISLPCFVSVSLLLYLLFSLFSMFSNVISMWFFKSPYPQSLSNNSFVFFAKIRIILSTLWIYYYIESCLNSLTNALLKFGNFSYTNIRM